MRCTSKTVDYCNKHIISMCLNDDVLCITLLLLNKSKPELSDQSYYNIAICEVLISHGNYSQNNIIGSVVEISMAVDIYSTMKIMHGQYVFPLTRILLVFWTCSQHPGRWNCRFPLSRGGLQIRLLQNVILQDCSSLETRDTSGCQVQFLLLF